MGWGDTAEVGGNSKTGPYQNLAFPDCQDGYGKCSVSVIKARLIDIPVLLSFIHCPLRMLNSGLDFA